jgi:abortive infection protein abiGII
MNKDSVTEKLRKRAKELRLNYNLVLNQFFFDEFLKLLSISKYQNNFMLKGGMLLTYTLGIQNRATQDIDFLVKGLTIDAVQIKDILSTIISGADTSGVWFEVLNDVDNIRLEDKYGGVRYHIIGHLSNIRVPFAIDIATGDPIYPDAKIELYTTILNEDILLRLYPLESVLAEKLQTVLARAENNSRSKDFYDIYTIMKNNEKQVDMKALKVSVDLTFAYRKTHILKNAALDIVYQINNNDEIKSRWNRYQKKNPYAKDISFESVIIEIKRLVELVL